jgi:hypothetical protein
MLSTCKRRIRFSSFSRFFPNKHGSVGTIAGNKIPIGGSSHYFCAECAAHADAKAKPNEPRILCGGAKQNVEAHSTKAKGHGVLFSELFGLAGVAGAHVAAPPPQVAAAPPRVAGPADDTEEAKKPAHRPAFRSVAIVDLSAPLLHAKMVALTKAGMLVDERDIAALRSLKPEELAAARFVPLTRCWVGSADLYKDARFAPPAQDPPGNFVLHCPIRWESVDFNPLKCFCLAFETRNRCREQGSDGRRRVWSHRRHRGREGHFRFESQRCSPSSSVDRPGRHCQTVPGSPGMKASFSIQSIFFC